MRLLIVGFFVIILLISVSCAEDLPYPQDVTPPRITSVYPVSGETNAAKNTIVTITFDDVMYLPSFNISGMGRAYVTQEGQTTREQLTTTLEDGGRKFILSRSSGYYQINQKYTVTLEPGVLNSGRVPWGSSTNYSFTFTARDRIEYYIPQITYTSPVFNNSVYYAGETFNITGIVTDIAGARIFNIEYYFHHTNGVWSNASSDNTEFTINIDPDNSVWSNYPVTNNVYIKIYTKKDSSEELSITWEKFNFIKDSWSITTFADNGGYHEARGFDYINLFGTEYWSQSGSPTGVPPIVTSIGWIDNTQGEGHYPSVDGGGPTIIIASEYYDAGGANQAGYVHYYDGGSWTEKSLGSEKHSFTIKYSGAPTGTVLGYLGNNVIYLATNVMQKWPGCSLFVAPPYETISDVKMAYDQSAAIAHFAAQEGVINCSMRYIKFDVNSSTKLDDRSLGSMEGAYSNLSISQKRRITAICLDDSQQPHIVYKQGIQNNIRYFHYTGTEWLDDSLFEANLPGSGNVTAVHCIFADSRFHLGYIRNGVAYYGYFYNDRWHIRKVGTAQIESFIRIVVNTPEIIIMTHSDSSRGSFKKFKSSFY